VNLTYVCATFLTVNNFRNKHLKLRQEVMNHFVNHLWTILSKLVMQIMPNGCGFPSVPSVPSTLEVAEE